MTSTLRLFAVFVLAAATVVTSGCGGDDDSSSSGGTVDVSGIAWVFRLGPYGRIAGATVSVLEDSTLFTATDENGEFTLEDVPVGSDATFVLSHENHPLTFTKTFTVPDHDIDDLTFQIPDWELYHTLEAFLDVETDPSKCQIVSTFTRDGKTIGDPGAHGEPGALLTMDPPGGAEEGPIYFNDQVLPDRTRTYSSIDGGVLLTNVEAGDYVLGAACMDDPTEMLEEYPPEEYADESLRCAFEDVEFESVRLKCRAGVFLNASPSYGLQALP